MSLEAECSRKQLKETPVALGCEPHGGFSNEPSQCFCQPLRLQVMGTEKRTGCVQNAGGVGGVPAAERQKERPYGESSQMF